ncbi:DUF1622 domain-containing protein [Streptomyces sp. DK15]|uniref:DUF1622 domain-containing protein n=1 Tax=Streptomyces sp. DK15 TaxID=2957499 RepID=UPI0029B080BD|nr:DUF1622 domain-containing protein [Streptomyces sp. DK15]MDX2391571.1 DUF1622 domain-containing protein [Streptomyces sp. DK15]
MSIEVLPESWLSDAIDLLARIVESIGALIIFVGAVWAFGRFLAVLVKGRGRERKYNQIRLNLSRFIALGLEFQLAADVLRTAVAPTFTDIGQLAAIAAIRTALNYFLAKEIDRESAEVKQDRQETSTKDRQDQLPPA